MLSTISILLFESFLTILFTGIHSTPVIRQIYREGYVVPFLASGHPYHHLQPSYGHPQQAHPLYPPVAQPAPAYHYSNHYKAPPAYHQSSYHPAPGYHQSNYHPAPASYHAAAPAYQQSNHQAQSAYNGNVYPQPQPNHSHPTGAPVSMPNNHPGGQAAHQARY